MAEDFTQRATCECYYKFENAGDLGEDNQNQIDLTNNNGVTQSSTIPSGTYANPSATKSASFVRASSQYLSANHDDSIELDDITELTVCYWIKHSSIPGSVVYHSKRTGSGDGHYFFSTNTTTVGVCFEQYGTVPQSAVSMDVWYFYAMVYDSVDDKIYVYRGTEEAEVALLDSVAAVNKTIDTAGGFGIGCTINDGGNNLDGLMCEPVWLSEALSLAELQEIQADGMEGTPVVEAPTPVLSKDGIHSLVFGGQVISG